MNNHFATYSRSDDCFPNNAPRIFRSGSGCHVTAEDGREFIDYGMGLRSVILGHAYPKVNEAVKKAIDNGVNFTRSNPYEGELKELIKSIIPCAEEVKFGKNGSDATSGAIKLARAYTGKDIILIASENAFYSQHDWFIGSTPVDGGIPWEEKSNTDKYSYNDMTAGKFKLSPMHIEKFIGQNDIAAIILDPSTVDITEEKLQYIRDLCDKYKIIMILDEVISCFRYDISGVQGMFGVKPDLCTLGKAMGNGFSISALCGRKDLFDLGLRGKGNVFLMSGTYFSETTGLAASIATIKELQDKNVPEYLWKLGQDFSDKLRRAIYKAKMDKYMQINDWMPCNPSIQYATYDDKFTPLELKTLFDQEIIKQGILMPYISLSYSHTDKEVSQTIEAAEMALATCKKAIDNDCVKESLLGGHCEAQVCRRT